MRNRSRIFFGIVVCVFFLLYLGLFSGTGSGDGGPNTQPQRPITRVAPTRPSIVVQQPQATAKACNEDALMEDMDKYLAQVAKLEGQIATVEEERDNAKTEVESLKRQLLAERREYEDAKLACEQKKDLDEERVRDVRKEAKEDSKGECELPKVIVPIKMRNDLGDILRREGKEFGVEIGVSKGQFAQQILKRWINFKRYYLVDTWGYLENYADFSNLTKQGYADILALTHSRVDKYGDRVVFYRNYSSEAVKKFEDESLDFVYVDARHDYKGVYEDLAMYWPKLKKGGIIAGHDYLNQEDVDRSDLLTTGKKGQDWTLQSDGTHAVDGRASRAAAEDFSKFVGRQMAITYQDETNNNYPTYYMRK